MHSLGTMDNQTNHSSPAGAPSLLPAFEPLSSSPGGILPRLSKRKYDEHARDERPYYPTPVPTSSTGLLPSSPRPALARTVSALSERAPLGAVPRLDVPANGEPILMGRSSNSSDYQLSANRLISRVHVRATYHAPEDQRPEGEIVVECVGWNGCKIHYRGQVVDLAKGETFVSNTSTDNIMVDVQDTRVLLVWPNVEGVQGSSRDSSTSPCTSPSKRRALTRDVLASSPPPMLPRIPSPKSLSPRNHTTTSFDTTFIASQPTGDSVQVYEDNDSVDGPLRDSTPTPACKLAVDGAINLASDHADASQESSSLSEPEELSEHDEENDPIIHSFGPFGDNLLEKFSTISSGESPILAAEGTPKFSSGGFRIKLKHSASASPRTFRESPVKNHVINQLAYSRVHSLPLSTIYSNVPPDMKHPKQLTTEIDTAKQQTDMSPAERKALMGQVPCIGHISREGKDAAGKPLEDEYYYLPDLDEDEPRRAAMSVGRPPMRNVRKQHKVSLLVSSSIDT